MENVKESAIKLELEWLESRFSEMRRWIDEHPLDEVEDRTEIIPTAKGVPIIKVIATQEAQIKAYQSLLKDIMSMLPELKKMREENAATQVEVRGGGEFNWIMNKRFKKDNPS